MGKYVQLALAIHNHQPVGNFGYVIHQACDMAYLPFLRMLAEFPHVRIGLHTSGCLWEWLEWNRPEYGRLVEDLVRLGQVELVGGGMHEPVLPVLPEGDALWQLERMNRFVKHRFGMRPIGMWCPERVWEPHLPALIAKAGLRYTLLDDYHFRASALPEAVATEYFMSSHAGAEIALLPISKKLRYTIPFKDVQATLDYLKELAANCARTPLAVFGDDGEKFGVWPDTYEWVYERGWLREFFTALTDNTDWLELLLPGEVLERRRAAGTVFIPCASYAEMGEWSRVDPGAGEDDPPGFWRNYFHKYPESYAMYQHALEVSELLDYARKQDLPEWVIADAADDLGRGQCNCAYWHGVFGGLYLNYLRQAVHHHLLKAEGLLLKHMPAPPAPAAAAGPPGSPPALRLQASSIALRVDAAHGLCTTRLDDLETAFCWSDVLARRREAYHAKLALATTKAADEHASIHDRVIAKEEGLLERVVSDPHVRVNFNTYFTDLQDPAQLMRVPAKGKHSPSRLYDDYGVQARGLATGQGTISGELDHGAFKLTKAYAAANSVVTCTVRLAQGMPPSEDVRFAIEFNLTVLTDSAPDRYLACDGKRLPLNQPQTCDGACTLALTDGWRRRRAVVHCPQASHVSCYPVYAVSSSEGGFERTYQGSCILICCHPTALVNGIECSLGFEEQKADDV
jgi:alpha-amylase